MIGLQETFIEGCVLIETLDNKKQSEEGREVDKREQVSRTEEMLWDLEKDRARLQR